MFYRMDLAPDDLVMIFITAAFAAVLLFMGALQSASGIVAH